MQRLFKNGIIFSFTNFKGKLKPKVKEEAISPNCSKTVR